VDSNLGLNWPRIFRSHSENITRGKGASIFLVDLKFDGGPRTRPICSYLETGIHANEGTPNEAFTK
jgi:hypothetical protein